jgi:hypothetical protein
MTRTTIRSEDITAGQVKAADLASDAVDTTGIQTDIAILGFKVAANGSLAKYDLVDQTIDDFQNATGIDTSTSSGETLTSGYYSGAAITTTNYSATSTGYQGTIQSYTVPSGLSSLSIEAWGARGGAGASSYKLAATTGTITNSTGGAGSHGGFGARMKGTFSSPPVAGSTIKILVGQAGTGDNTADHGHSGGGGGTFAMVDHGVSSTAGTTKGVGNSTRYSPLVVAGGGGAASVYSGYSYGQSGTPWNAESEVHASATESATAHNNSYATAYAFTPGTAGSGGGINTAGDYIAGAGGGFLTDGTTTDTTHSDANEGAGGDSFLNGGEGANSGGTGYGNYYGGFGGGGGGNLAGAGGGGGYSGGGGGSGLWSNISKNGGGGGSIINSDYGGSSTTATGGAADKQTSPGSGHGYVTLIATIEQDMTLISNSTTAEAVPTKGDLVMTYTNGAGTATKNVDIKGWVSRDNGTTYTQFTLADEGDTGGHTILTAHDLDISAQPSGSAMRYKITTHNQSASKETRIQAVSLGWS